MSTAPLVTTTDSTPAALTSDDESFERYLRDVVDDASKDSPRRLREALVHAVFPGGGRLRPRLCLGVARACLRSGDALVPPGRRALAAASAVELMHCASLVHDDLPCFDGAETRRGRPSVQHAFGEAMAVLVGDGLLVLAFDVLARVDGSFGRDATLALARAAGPTAGLVAGQAWELEDVVDLTAYHRGKTASLFELACLLGARLSEADDEDAWAAWGRSLGMAYQAADDYGDRAGSASELGKPVGRDRALKRPTAAGGDKGMTRRRTLNALEQVVRGVPECPGRAELQTRVSANLQLLARRVNLLPAGVVLGAARYSPHQGG